MFRQNISQHRWYRHRAIINIRFVISFLSLLIVGIDSEEMCEDYYYDC